MSAVTPQAYAEALAGLVASGTTEKKLADAVDAVADELVASGRRRWLGQVLTAFEQAMDKRDGKTQVTIETPHALTASERTHLAKALFRDPKDIRTEEHVQGSAQAGWSIHVGDRMVRNTVSDRLAKIFK